MSGVRILIKKVRKVGKWKKVCIFATEMDLRKHGITEASSMAADKRIHESTELRIYDNNYGRL